MRFRLLALTSVAVVAVAGPIAPRAFRPLALAPAAGVAVAQPSPPRPAACPATSTFTLHVERPNRTPAKGLQVVVKAGGRAGVRKATDVVSASGEIALCIRDATSGEMVEVTVAPESFLVLYPSHRQLALSSQGTPSVVVCETGRDCSQLSEADVVRIIQKALPQIRSMTANEKAAFFREWADYARQLSRDANADIAQLFTALVRKERQITAASQASNFLLAYVNKVREVVVRFERHAERALVNRDLKGFDDINKAIVAYNPIFDQLSEKTDGYLKETSDYWSTDVSAELRALFGEAREFHKQCIYPLNVTKELINACIRREPECPGMAAARRDVQKARSSLRNVTTPRLDRFEKRATDWLDSLDGRLFGDPAPSSPPAPRRNNQ